MRCRQIIDSLFPTAVYSISEITYPILTESINNMTRIADSELYHWTRITPTTAAITDHQLCKLSSVILFSVFGVAPQSIMRLNCETLQPRNLSIAI